MAKEKMTGGPTATPFIYFAGPEPSPGCPFGTEPNGTFNGLDIEGKMRGTTKHTFPRPEKWPSNQGTQ